MGKQGWYQAWCQGSRAGNALEPWHKPGTRPKWLKFILILSNFLRRPVLNNHVTLFIFPSFWKKNLKVKFYLFGQARFQVDRGQGTWGWKRPSHLTQTLTDLLKTWCMRIFWRVPSPKPVTTGVSKLDVSRCLTLSVFCGNKFRYESFNVEWHMDPNIGKATIGKERTVASSKESLRTSRGPHRNCFLEVWKIWRSRN